MKTLKLKAYDSEYNVALYLTNYVDNNNTAIEILWIQEEDGEIYPEPWGVMTKNLTPYAIEFNKAYVDTNNMPYIEDFIKQNKLGKPTGNMMPSGFCVYPEYEFDMYEISKYLYEESEV